MRAKGGETPPPPRAGWVPVSPAPAGMDTVVESYRKWNAFLPPAVVQRFIERLAVTGTPAAARPSGGRAGRTHLDSPPKLVLDPVLVHMFFLFSEAMKNDSFHHLKQCGFQ